MSNLGSGGLSKAGLKKIGNLGSGRLRTEKEQTDFKAGKKSMKYKKERKTSFLFYQIIDFTPTLILAPAPAPAPT